MILIRSYLFQFLSFQNLLNMIKILYTIHKKFVSYFLIHCHTIIYNVTHAFNVYQFFRSLSLIVCTREGGKRRGTKEEKNERQTEKLGMS